MVTIGFHCLYSLCSPAMRSASSSSSLPSVPSTVVPKIIQSSLRCMLLPPVKYERPLLDKGSYSMRTQGFEAKKLPPGDKRPKGQPNLTRIRQGGESRHSVPSAHVFLTSANAILRSWISSKVVSSTTTSHGLAGAKEPFPTTKLSCSAASDFGAFASQISVPKNQFGLQWHS